MKWFIASDIHGSAMYCEQMVEAFHREGAQRIVLLGDLLYHGPRNELPEGYDPKAVIPMLNSLKNQVLCVRGNCDAEVDQMVIEFPILADMAVMDMGAKLLFLTHGHVYGEHNLPSLGEGDILICGHTHVPICRVREHYVYLNPGSVALPKEGSPRGYMILENGEFLWKKLDGEVWQSYRAW